MLFALGYGKFFWMELVLIIFFGVWNIFCGIEYFGVWNFFWGKKYCLGYRIVYMFLYGVHFFFGGEVIRG